MSNRAWVTLATNDSYGLGALVLAHSLRRANSSYQAVVLITPSVTDAMRERLRAVFADVVTVDVLDSRDAAHLALLQRPELGITFTKIHCWSLTQYEKCVFLDADTLVIQNCDELFEREEFSAAPDVGWPDCFNSGVFVFKPSNETFEQLIKFAQERGSFDGGDQGLLNSFFSDWAHGDINKHLPFLYNVTSAAFYSYLPALKHYGQDLKIIHFIGIAKPWLQQFNWESRTVDAPDHLKGLLQLWWDLFVGQVHPQLDVTMVEVQDHTPALPPHDVSQHYAPVLDPESEFPWHHPDAQPKDDYHREEIDLEQFHDPWEIYRGQIPPIKEDTSTHNTVLGRMDDHEEMKKYAWEYQPQHQEYNPVAHSQESTSHHIYQPEQTYKYHNHEGQETQTHYHQPEHHWESHSQDKSTHYHYHQPDEQHWHQEQHQHEQQYFSYQEDHVQQNHENKQEYTDHEQKHYSHEHHSEHQSHQHHSHQPHYEHSHSHSDHFSHHHTEKHGHEYSDPKSHFHTHTHNVVAQVHRVHIDHDTILKLQSLKKNRPEMASNEMMNMNGDISESESDYYEDIRPRHPYDGFYLRHRATIDARGHKICSHEIPPTPSPSLSPPPDLDHVECPPDLLTEETTHVNYEEHSGVAGNLARVTPGSSGSQREALDELTRRQGWEAGNIDYMGADSFDNIWAKISQTLSQPRVSPSKQPAPPKQPSPPKQEAPAPPVEVAQEAASIDAPAPQAAPAPVETQTLAAAEAPVKAVEPPTAEAVPIVEAPIAAQTAAPVKAAPSAEATVEAPAAVKDAPVPEATPAVKAADSVEPTEIPVTVAAIAAESQEAPAAALPVGPSDIPVTVEAASAPGETPSEVPVSVETAAAPEVAKDEPQKTETSALPPTPPVTPKSTPETTPVSENAPQVDPVKAQSEVSVPASEPASDSAPQVVSVETPKEEVPVPVSEPVSESAPKGESEVQKVEDAAPASAPVSESAPKVESEIQKVKDSAPVSAPVTESAPKVESEIQKVEVSEPASAPVSESAPAVESVEAKKEVSESAPEPVPESESTPKVEPVESPKEEVPASEPASASDTTPKVETQIEEMSPASTPALESTPKVEPVETPKEEAPAPVEAPKAPVEAPKAPEAPATPVSTPEKPYEIPSPAASTDSPPLANTPSKEEAPALPAAKSEERRKVGKLQLRPPSVADPLPTPDSELEDAASLAQSIIASELRTPTVTAPAPHTPASPPLTPQDARLSVDEPEVPTPPISLAQIGVKPAPKAKPTTAAQIESSLAEKSDPAASADQPAPKKKIVKKVKKESAAGGEAPVPPPRKKEKKPKEK